MPGHAHNRLASRAHLISAEYGSSHEKGSETSACARSNWHSNRPVLWGSLHHRLATNADTPAVHSLHHGLRPALRHIDAHRNHASIPVASIGQANMTARLSTAVASQLPADAAVGAMEIHEPAGAVRRIHLKYGACVPDIMASQAPRLREWLRARRGAGRIQRHRHPPQARTDQCRGRLHGTAARRGQEQHQDHPGRPG